ncbi:MAG: FlgD immunoglobulin-like domain containing protein [bacterium]
MTSTTPDQISGLAISGDRAYAAWGTDGLIVINIRNPLNPWFEMRCTTGGHANELALAGDYAYLADGAGGLRCVHISQRALNITDDLGQSLSFEQSVYPVQQVRLKPTAIDYVGFSFSADGGVNWQYTLENDTWYSLVNPGGDLLWRATLYYSFPPTPPTCSSLTVDWLYEFPIIDSIEDVGNDQGRQVSISWTRSAYDFLGSSSPIHEYAVYRKIDEGLPSGSGSVDLGNEVHDSSGSAEKAPGAALYPPGAWHFLMTVPASTEETYATVVPTLADSTVSSGMYASTFFVRALTATPGVHYDALPDSGYSVDNLAPGVPAGFTAAYGSGGNQLSWEASQDDDFRHFSVYRSSSPEVQPAPENLVHQTIDNSWLDTDGMNPAYYLLTATDFSGNESAPAEVDITSSTAQDEAPQVFALHQNTPNPFNPMTMIHYDVPASGGTVRIDVFDLSGRLVKNLIREPHAPGRYSVVWNGTDRSGRSVASGAYYFRLQGPGFDETRKMLLVR